MKSAIILSIKHGNFTGLSRTSILFSKLKQTTNLGFSSKAPPPACRDVTGRRPAVVEVRGMAEICSGLENRKRVSLNAGIFHCDCVLLGC